MSGSIYTPVIVFDELGLAEISTNNPLKVLHALLEPDERNIAFVGYYLIIHYKICFFIIIFIKIRYF